MTHSAIVQGTDSTLTYSEPREKLGQLVDGMTLQFRILSSTYVSSVQQKNRLAAGTKVIPSFRSPKEIP